MIDLRAPAARSATGHDMGSAARPWPSAALALIAASAGAVGLGLALRLSVVSTGSLWLDELWTLDAVSRSFREMIGARLVSDQSPPLWTVLTWAWLQVTGTYESGVVRLLATAFNLVAVAAPIVGAAFMTRLRPTLLVMGAILALSLFPLQYAVELRAYSLMLGLGSIATVIWAGLLTRELPRTAAWIFLFCFSGALAGFGHYYGNLLYVGELIVLLIATFGSAGYSMIELRRCP